jgi:hypothetical protein
VADSRRRQSFRGGEDGRQAGSEGTELKRKRRRRTRLDEAEVVGTQGHNRKTDVWHHRRDRATGREVAWSKKWYN